MNRRNFVKGLAIAPLVFSRSGQLAESGKTPADKSLHKVFAGFQPGELVVIGGVNLVTMRTALQREISEYAIHIRREPVVALNYTEIARAVAVRRGDLGWDNGRLWQVNRMLRQAARDQKCPVVLIVRTITECGRQLSISDIRRLGGVDSEADRILFLNRKFPSERERLVSFTLNIAKVRNGSLGASTHLWDEKRRRFV